VIHVPIFRIASAKANGFSASVTRNAMAQLTSECMNSSTCNQLTLGAAYRIELRRWSRAIWGQGRRGPSKIGGWRKAWGEGTSTCSCLLGCYLLWLRLEGKL